MGVSFVVFDSVDLKELIHLDFTSVIRRVSGGTGICRIASTMAMSVPSKDVRLEILNWRFGVGLGGI